MIVGFAIRLCRRFAVAILKMVRTLRRVRTLTVALFLHKGVFGGTGRGVLDAG